MSDPYGFSPAPLDHWEQSESTSTRAPRYRFGLLLTLAGNLLVIVAFFSPWFVVSKLNDPTFYVPKRGYSPWIVLESGQPHSLGILMWVFLLLILGMALSSLVLALARTMRRRSQTAAIARALAVLSLVMMIIGVPGIPYGLSFEWPFLHSTPTYGIVLAVAGFVSVLIGLATLSTYFPRWRDS